MKGTGRWACAAALAAVLAAAPAAAVEWLDPLSAPLGPSGDLVQPTEATAFHYQPGANRLFKPDGAGPFPGLVLMPTCSGHLRSNTFDWAKRAVAHGYAVLVVDPLTPRRVGTNCERPIQVSSSRLMKDAKDAAAHLRKQSFVRADRIGLMGFSQGAMVGLGAAGAKHMKDYGPPFDAVASFYPVCIVRNVRSPRTGQAAAARYTQAEIVVPLRVAMGELDNEGYPKDCLPFLEQAKAKGAPVEFQVYKDATHSWDVTETRYQSFSKRGAEGQTIVYHYNDEATEQSAKDAFAFLDARLKRN